MRRHASIDQQYFQLLDSRRERSYAWRIGSVGPSSQRKEWYLVSRALIIVATVLALVLVAIAVPLVAMMLAGLAGAPHMVCNSYPLPC
jgi:Flp pilus assembly protein TadB